MSIKAQIVDTLKNLLGVYAEEKFDKTYSASDLKISDKSVGGKVEIIGGDGTLSPAPDGEYTFEDGNEYQVKDGLITNIVKDSPEEDKAEGEMQSKPEEGTPAEESTETPEEEAGEDAEEDAAMQALTQKVAELESKMADMQQQLEALSGSQQMAASKRDVDHFSKQVQELNDTIKKLAKIPAEFSKANDNIKVKESKEEKLLEVAMMLGKK
jgi:uncharacterized coiled-coil protein SlyX